MSRTGAIAGGLGGSGIGEVLASEAVAETAGGGAFGFERIHEVDLKGLPERVALFRVTR
jgi:hypothetical protein